MTDHAKVLREMAVERTAEIAACAAGADAIEECERLRADLDDAKEDAARLFTECCNHDITIRDLRAENARLSEQLAALDKEA